MNRRGETTISVRMKFTSSAIVTILLVLSKDYILCKWYFKRYYFISPLIGLHTQELKFRHGLTLILTVIILLIIVKYWKIKQNYHY